MRERLLYSDQRSFSALQASSTFGFRNGLHIFCLWTSERQISVYLTGGQRMIGNFLIAAFQILGLEFLPLLNLFLPLLNLLAAGSAIVPLLLKKSILYHKRRHFGMIEMIWEDMDARFFKTLTSQPILFYSRVIYINISISGGLPSSPRAWKSQLLIFNENSVVILELVVTQSLGFLSDMNRLVVASSRARDTLYVIAKKACIDNSNSRAGRFMKRYLS